MSCERCTDPDGIPCFPMYGHAPHVHTSKGMVFTGETVDGFTPEPDELGMGTWWCPHCNEGKPE